MKKNLRKLLAVVLVVCLAFSLVTIASAKQIGDYSDASSVTYKEAVDLVTGLGIMQGAGGTTFDATGTFTREMAAKVICYILLGPAVSANLTTSTSSFSDVAATRWSAPFIEYCVSIGVINGMGNGTFAPTASVTGSQFAKMLLTAIGYGVKGEYTGANWEINVLAKAQQIGILDLGINYSAAATREQVAKYVYNVLTKAACGVTSYNAVNGTYNAAGSTLGATTFTLTNVASTANGINSHKFTAVLNGVVTNVSGTYVDDNVIATSTDGTSVTNLTTAGNTKFKAALDTSPATTYFGNGTPAANLGAADALVVTGSVVKLIDNDKDGLVDKVQITNKTVDFVTGAVSVDAAGTVTIPGVGTYVKDTVTYPALVKNDVVLKYTNAAGYTYIEKATAITGTMTAKTATGAAVFEGVTRAQSGLTGTTALGGFTTYNTASTIWVDDNGNIVHFLVTDTASTANYCVLLDDAMAGITAQGKLLMSDGTTKVVTIATVGGVAANGAATNGVWYTYTVNTDGTYALTVAATGGSVTVSADANGAAVGIANVAQFDGTRVGNSSTKFIVPSNLVGGTAGTYTVYTGVANVPAFGVDALTQIVAIDSVATLVYVSAGTATITSSINNIYFVNAASYTEVAATTTTAAYRIYDAIVNGAATTVKVLNTSGTEWAQVTTGLYAVTYDANGFITDSNGAVGANKATGVGVTSAAGGTVTLGGGVYTYDANTVVYNVSVTGVITVGTISDLAVDASDNYTVLKTASTTDPADLLGAIYVQSSYAAAAVANAGPVKGLSAATTVTTWGNVATYTVTVTGTATADATITLTNGTWAATIPVLAGVTRTSNTVITVANTTNTGAGYVVTFTTTLTADSTPAPTLVIA